MFRGSFVTGTQSPFSQAAWWPSPSLPMPSPSSSPSSSPPPYPHQHCHHHKGTSQYTSFTFWVLMLVSVCLVIYLTNVSVRQLVAKFVTKISSITWYWWPKKYYWSIQLLDQCRSMPIAQSKAPIMYTRAYSSETGGHIEVGRRVPARRLLGDTGGGWPINGLWWVVSFGLKLNKTVPITTVVGFYSASLQWV